MWFGVPSIDTQPPYITLYFQVWTALKIGPKNVSRMKIYMEVSCLWKDDH